MWAADITYLPIGRGFLYLVAIIDWASRAVLAWRLSNTMDVSFCVAALEEALAKYGTPEIFNTSRAASSPARPSPVRWWSQRSRSPWDGRGRCMDNVFIERLWRSLKHVDIYLKGYADGREAKAGIASWIAFYNDRRLHQALGYRTPMAVWRERMQAAKAVDMLDNADALTTCPQQQGPAPRVHFTCACRQRGDHTLVHCVVLAIDQFNSTPGTAGGQSDAITSDLLQADCFR